MTLQEILSDKSTFFDGLSRRHRQENILSMLKLLYLLVAKLEISNWGAEVTVPKISIKLGGRKRIYPKISIRKLHTLHY
ncbi:hypothetical protein HanPSC8_Chr08g0324211 [Helianthus annuus]|nr:hypothetical protein HanPSC8_Chr08g0324211 [Helianthus annuus]